MLATQDICSGPDLLGIDEALAVALATVRPVAHVEIVPIGRSVGRIAAADVAASIPLPPFDQSAVDGYGIRSDDLLAAPETAFREAGVLTGAPVPADVDAVVMEEKVRGGRVAFSWRPEPGMNIRRRGEDVGAGSTILAARTVIDARHVAILAASGVPNIKVCRRIAVGVLSTGSELVAARHSLGQHQIHDSNGPMLAALVGGPALRVTPLGRCRDDRGRLARRLTQMARSYDLLVCSGGVSRSDADHMVAAVRDAGGACAKLALALKPGKPLAVGAIGPMAVLALPGNPFASLVGALLFARPMLQTLAGSYRGRRPPLAARTGETFAHRRGRMEFVPVRVSARDERGVPLLEKLGRGGSARLLPLILADGLACIPSGSNDLPSDAPVDYFPFDAAFSL